MQYQSLLFSKFEQISANVVFATLLLYFGYPRKSIFSSSDVCYKTSVISPQIFWFSTIFEDALKCFFNGFSFFIFQWYNPSIFTENIYHHKKIFVAFIPFAELLHFN